MSCWPQRWPELQAQTILQGTGLKARLPHVASRICTDLFAAPIDEFSTIATNEPRRDEKFSNQKRQFFLYSLKNYLLFFIVSKVFTYYNTTKLNKVSQAIMFPFKGSRSGSPYVKTMGAELLRGNAYNFEAGLQHAIELVSSEEGAIKVSELRAWDLQVLYYSMCWAKEA